MVCEVPLQDQVGLQMPIMDIDVLLDRIVIGPCVYPQQVAFAFREILRELGVSHPDSRIAMSGVPLRQQG